MSSPSGTGFSNDSLIPYRTALAKKARIQQPGLQGIGLGLAIATRERLWLHSSIMPGKLAGSIGSTAIQDLQNARRLHGLSRRCVAAVVGCSEVTLKFWETGRRKPSRISANWLAALASKIKREGDHALNDFLGSREF